MAIQREELVKLAEFIDTTFKRYRWEWSINCGGCGVFALAVSDRLKRLGIKHRFMAMTHVYNDVTPPKWGHKFYQPSIREFNNDGDLGISHCVVEMIGYKKPVVIDSTGYLNDRLADLMDDYDAIKTYMSRPLLEKLVRDRRSWNPEFDRRRVPAIKKKLDRAFNEWGEMYGIAL